MDGTINLIFWLVLIFIYVPWEFSDNPFREKTTLFSSFQDCNLGTDKCIEGFNKRSFRVIPELQLVVTKNHDLNLPPYKLRDCIVFDKDNWECKGFFSSNIPIGKSNGEWTLDTGDDTWTINAYNWKIVWLLERYL